MRWRPLALAVVAALVGPASAGALTDRQAARRGAAWLAAQPVASPGQQADVVVALAAAGRPAASLRGRMAQLQRSGPAYAVTAGAAGKVVLAAVAAGRDPARLGGVNYLARIRSRYAGGRYGVTAYDQAYAILALRAARQPVPRAAISALRNTRGAGGWGFALRPRGDDDASATGLVIEALRSAGVPASDPMLRGAAAWLLAQRNRSGGYNIDGPGGPTEANSTALAIRALRAMGRTPPPTTRARLRGLQETDGGFRFTARIRESRLLATVDAVIALAGRRLPPPYPGS